MVVQRFFAALYLTVMLDYGTNQRQPALTFEGKAGKANAAKTGPQGRS